MNIQLLLNPDDSNLIYASAMNLYGGLDPMRKLNREIFSDELTVLINRCKIKENYIFVAIAMVSFIMPNFTLLELINEQTNQQPLNHCVMVGITKSAIIIRSIIKKIESTV